MIILKMDIYLIYRDVKNIQVDLIHRTDIS